MSQAAIAERLATRKRLGRNTAVNRLCRNCVFVLVGIFLALVPLVGEAQVPRPTAPQLLPTYTLAAVRITDMPTLTSRFQQTALGQISQDARMKPLVGQIFQAA